MEAAQSNGAFIFPASALIGFFEILCLLSSLCLLMVPHLTRKRQKALSTCQIIHLYYDLVRIAVFQV